MIHTDAPKLFACPASYPSLSLGQVAQERLVAALVFLNAYISPLNQRGNPSVTLDVSLSPRTKMLAIKRTWCLSNFMQQLISPLKYVFVAMQWYVAVKPTLKGILVSLGIGMLGV